MEYLEFEDFDKYLLSQDRRIIHQVWFGTIPNKRKASVEYKKLKTYRDSWKIKNPNWTHIEWNKKLSDQLVRLYFPGHYSMYRSYEHEIQRCDMVRYCFLYRYGGLYADMDYYCVKPFDTVIEEYTGDFYLVQTPNMSGDFVSNSLMYSRKNHPFWLVLLVEMEKSQSSPIYYSRHLSIMYTAGPGIVNRVYQTYKVRYMLKSYPHKYFQPHGQADDILNMNIPNVYTVHASKGCWHSNDSAIIVLIARDWPIMLFILVVFAIVLVYLCLQNGVKVMIPIDK